MHVCVCACVCGVCVHACVCVCVVCVCVCVLCVCVCVCVCTCVCAHHTDMTDDDAQGPNWPEVLTIVEPVRSVCAYCVPHTFIHCALNTCGNQGT